MKEKHLYMDDDADLGLLSNKVVVVVGYGTQGTARALNMRDSGLKVLVGAEQGSDEWKRAEEDGLEVVPVEEAGARGDIFEVEVPDMAYRAAHAYETRLKPHAKKKHMLCFSSAMNYYYDIVKPGPEVDAVVTAAKGPGSAVRTEYVAGFGVPALLGIHQDATGQAWELGLAVCKGMGFTRAGVQRTTIEEETCTDLLGEHCAWGAIIQLLKVVFEVMVEEGFDPRVAFYEAVNESKLTTDLIYKYGLAGMLERISNTAAFGAMSIGPRIIDQHVKDNIRGALKNIKDGGFNREWRADFEQGYPQYKKLLAEIRSHKAEVVGNELRRKLGVHKPKDFSITNPLK